MSRKKDAKMDFEADEQALEIWNLVQLKGISPANKQTLYMRIKRYLVRYTKIL